MNKNEKTINNKIDKIDKVINEYIKKICQLDNLNKTFDEKLKNIDDLTDNLIDFCIKKKIIYFIENKINYTNIINNFKIYLIKFIKNLVDPNNDVINKYIINNDDNISISNLGWDNVSDLNSIMFKNYKNLNETFEKNVSFENKIEITNYDEGNDGFQFNKSNITNINNNNNINIDIDVDIDEENINNKILPIYIKLLINQNKYLIEFTDKLIKMCSILSEHDIKYKKLNPYN
jgi:hypothetical protein